MSYEESLESIKNKMISEEEEYQDNIKEMEENLEKNKA